MGFQMNCDRCGRSIRNLSVKELKNLPEDEVVCKNCQKTEKEIRRKVEKLKATAEIAFRDLGRKLGDQITEAIHSSVNKGSKKDAGTESES